MAPQIADFQAGVKSAQKMIPIFRCEFEKIRADGKVAWIGVGPSNAFIGFSPAGASAPYLPDTKELPYTDVTIGENVSIAFRNGFWSELNREFNIRTSRYLFREVVS